MKDSARLVENILALGGGGLMLFTGYQEALAACTTHPFPWAAFIIGAVCVAPKTLGRATAGRIWSRLGGKMGGSDDEPPVR